MVLSEVADLIVVKVLKNFDGVRRLRLLPP